MVAVMGSTGNVGGGVVRRLLDAGEDVRALGRLPRCSCCDRGRSSRNFHAVLDLIAEQGVNADAVAPDVAIPMIATREGRAAQNTTTTSFKRFAAEPARAGDDASGPEADAADGQPHTGAAGVPAGAQGGRATASATEPAYAPGAPR